MSRFAARQPDLFAPRQPGLFDGPAAAAPPAPAPDPIAELEALLTLVRNAEHLPSPNLSATMQAEYHALHLAGLAGEEGRRLLSAIFVETERLLSATD